MSLKTELNDLSENLIACIYKYLPEKDMFNAARCSKKFYSAFQKDFLMEELAKNSMIFLPSDEGRGETWKDVFTFLKKYKTAEKSGRPRSFKMVPYRGHKTPIEALCAFENEYNFDSTIVSGDDDGNVFTWNLEIDEDDEDEKIMVKDLIFKAEEGIKGIKKFKDDKNMIVWTVKNKFFIYDVKLYKSDKFDKNSKRFELKTYFAIDSDDNIEEVYYNEKEDKIFLSGNLSGNYTNTLVYCYNLKTLSLEIYNFGYDNIQADFINKDEPGQNAPQPNNINNDIDEFFTEIINDNYKYTRINHSNNNFVICGNKVIVYINKEPVKKRFIKSYNCKKLLPNSYFIDQDSKLYKDFHIDFDYIYNIIKISEDKVGFIGIDSNKHLSIKIYTTENPVLVGEKALCSDIIDSISKFHLLYSEFPEKQELYFLINKKEHYKMNLANLKQINVRKLKTLEKNFAEIICAESDRHRMVIAGNELNIAIFDITNGDFWFYFLGGSLSVQPKSFVKHPLYDGFHIVKITRNAIICVVGNLIREYKFVFNK